MIRALGQHAPYIEQSVKDIQVKGLLNQEIPVHWIPRGVQRLRFFLCLSKRPLAVLGWLAGWAGGPFKPSVGLSGAVPLLGRAAQSLVRAFLQPTRIQFPLALRSLPRSGESCSTPSLPHARTTRDSPDFGGCSEAFDELPIIANVEIVVPLLPEVPGIADQSPRQTLLQRLERFRERRT